MKTSVVKSVFCHCFCPAFLGSSSKLGSSYSCLHRYEEESWYHQRQDDLRYDTQTGLLTNPYVHLNTIGSVISTHNTTSCLLLSKWELLFCRHPFEVTVNLAEEFVLCYSKGKASLCVFSRSSQLCAAIHCSSWGSPTRCSHATGCCLPAIWPMSQHSLCRELVSSNTSKRLFCVSWDFFLYHETRKEKHVFGLLFFLK